MSERGLAEDDFAFSWYDEGGELLDNTFLRRLDGLDLISRKILQGKLKGERRSKKRGHSVEFADFRQYSHGDDLRFLDWNIYGRLDRLFIKMFLEEEDLFVYILVDGSTSMDYGSPNKFRYAMKLAAAHALADSVGEPTIERILPNPLDKSVAPKVAKAVQEAWEKGVRLAGDESGRMPLIDPDEGL